MKKLNKVAVLFASAALAAPLASFAAAHGGMAGPKANDNWRAADGTVVKNGTNDLCWRDGSWTPATADQACDGAIKPPPPPPPPAPPPAPRAAPAPAPAVPQAPMDAPPAVMPVVPVAPRVAPPPPPPAPVSEKVSYQEDALFDFAKSALKPDVQARLSALVDKTKGISLEVIIATGHADAIGSAAQNLALSTARADAVKKFLTGKGIDPSRVFTEGKGSTSPVADNSTAEGRAKNRRVEVEVVGTRTRR